MTRSGSAAGLGGVRAGHAQSARDVVRLDACVHPAGACDSPRHVLNQDKAYLVRSGAGFGRARLSLHAQIAHPLHALVRGTGRASRMGCALLAPAPALQPTAPLRHLQPVARACAAARVRGKWLLQGVALLYPRWALRALLVRACLVALRAARRAPRASACRAAAQLCICSLI
jgi:hypothetical protein